MWKHWMQTSYPQWRIVGKLETSLCESNPREAYFIRVTLLHRQLQKVLLDTRTHFPSGTVVYCSHQRRTSWGLGFYGLFIFSGQFSQKVKHRSFRREFFPCSLCLSALTRGPWPRGEELQKQFNKYLDSCISCQHKTPWTIFSLKRHLVNALLHALLFLSFLLGFINSYLSILITPHSSQTSC